MKYIIFKNNEGWEQPVIFPKAVNHDQMALTNANLGRPISAGFIRLNADGKFVAGGQSVSLGIGSRTEDTGLIIKAIESEW